MSAEINEEAIKLMGKEVCEAIVKAGRAEMNVVGWTADECELIVAEWEDGPNGPVQVYFGIRQGEDI